MRRSLVRFAPPPCQRLPFQTSTLPFFMTAGIGVWSSPKFGDRSDVCVPGTRSVAPFSSVKSVSAHIELHTSGTCGFGRGIS